MYIYIEREGEGVIFETTTYMCFFHGKNPTWKFSSGSTESSQVLRNARRKSSNVTSEVCKNSVWSTYLHPKVTPPYKGLLTILVSFTGGYLKQGGELGTV